MDYYTGKNNDVYVSIQDINLTEIARRSLKEDWRDEEIEEEIGSQIGSVPVSRDEVKEMVRKVRELQCE